MHTDGLDRTLNITAGSAKYAKMNRHDRLNKHSKTIVGAAIEVHRLLGPGLLESAYEACLAFELADKGLMVKRQVAVPVVYRGIKLDCGYRLDLFVENSIVVEIKSVEKLEPIHIAQVLSYLRLVRSPLGLLINFNVALLKHGIRRIVNNFPDPLRS